MRPARQTATQRRQHAQRRGRFAEWLCLWHLRLRGWRILAKGWRCPSGEIDILARRGRVLAIIEVKSRNELDAAASALLPDGDFYARPVEPGDAVTLVWSERDVHVLADV